MVNKLEIKSVLSNSRNYTVFGLICIALGLSLSKPAISLGYIFLGFSWLVSGDFLSKLKSFYVNKIALMLAGIYLLSVIGLINTSNFEYGLDDVRRKMFLFIMPFVLSGLPSLSNKELHLILKVYIIGVIASTLWSLFVYIGGINIEIYDYRDYSRFNSHIRFGLEITIAIFFAGYYWFRLKQKLLWSVAIIWLITSLVLFKLFTGSIMLVLVTLILMFIVGSLSKNNKLKYVLVSFFPIVLIISGWFIKSSIDNYYKAMDVEPLKEIPYSKYGEGYYKNDNTIKSTIKENGYYVEKNIAWTEIRETWNKRSKIDFNDKDLKGNILRHTIVRYITSKGERKDREAIENLTKKEIEAIERGIPNYKYLEMNFLSVRMHKIIWEFDNYNNGGDYNGHSVIMRWVYWKTAFDIIKTNFWFGVGTGDVQDAFNDNYKSNNTKLKSKYWLRAHNQYLTYFLSFGVLGFLVFIVFLFYPIIKTKMYKNYLYLSFFAVICLSMLTEDTLETQVGINLFVFFNCLFLFNKASIEKLNKKTDLL